MNSLKTILTSSVAAISFVAAPALAQQPTPTPLAPAEIQAAPEITPRTYDEVYGERFAAWGDLPVQELLGKTVVNEAGETIGGVDSFALADDQIVAIVGIGGFLGLGRHEVAVPIDRLTFGGEDGQQLILAGVTREQLQGLPEWDEGNEVFATDQTLRGGYETFGETAAMTGDEAQPLDPMAPGTEVAADADALTDKPAEDLAAAGNAIRDTAAGAAAAVATAGHDAATAVDNAAERAAENVADAARGVGDAIAPADRTAQAPAEPMSPAGPLTEAPVATDLAANDARGWTEEMDTIFADIADRQIAELIGMPVAGADGEVVGEIDNFVLEGDSVVAVVGVGGFLGIGERDVALSLDQMTFDGEKLVLSSLTGEQLRELPEFDATEPNYLPQDGTLRSPYAN